jgi:ketosteroid isomerase-like protein
MTLKLVSSEDFIALSNLMGAYQHIVDGADEDAYADLFTEDGAFLGLPEAVGPPDSFRGREGLKKIPRFSQTHFAGMYRHNMCSFSAEYGDTKDVALVRYYVLATISVAGQAPTVAAQIIVNTHLIRIAGQWKIKSNRMTQL